MTFSQQTKRLLRVTPLGATLALLPLLAACEGEQTFTRALQIEHMSQTIGGPAAAARPGDYLLENDKLRAVVHGRHNMRSTFPIANGSLIDLDIQRPALESRMGRGEDAFYELGPMVNLKLNSSTEMEVGTCAEVQKKTGGAPCPTGKECVRVSASGPGENLMGILGLLDLAIRRQSFSNTKLKIRTDYDLCAGEPYVKVTTSAQFTDKAHQVISMAEVKKSTGLLDVLLGEHTGQICEQDSDCKAGESCTSLLIEIPLGSFTIKMRRCRAPSQSLAGVLAGDFTFFSAKVNVFIPEGGFDHESYIRSVFDTGGDTFSNPLAASFIAGVSDEVSYAYFNKDGKAMVPVFTEAFTAAMTNRYACPAKDPKCLDGKVLRFTRYVSVGQGDVASAMEGLYQVRGYKTGRVEGHVIDARSRKPRSGIDVFAVREPRAWASWDDAQVGEKLRHMGFEELEAMLRKESATAQNAFGNPGIVSHFRTDRGLDRVKDGSFGGPLPVEDEWCNQPACRYILVARQEGRPASRLVGLRLAEGQTSRVTLVLGDPGKLRYSVRDAAGRPIPAKITIGHCFAECAVDADCKDPARPKCDLGVASVTDKRGLCVPEGGYGGPADCRQDQTWNEPRKTCVCNSYGLLPLSMGGHRYSDGTVRVKHTTDGQGELSMEPGVYQVVVSRGMEYSTARRFIRITPGTVTNLEAALARVVDTSGWISADFHVHGPNSVDAPAMFQQRIASMVAEGVELVTATDHDYLTDYAPTIHELGLRPWIKSQVGLEVSPLDYGHFIGFPLRFDERAEQNGAFHWRRTKTDKEKASMSEGDDDWVNLAPGTIFKKLRELGSLGLEKTVVFVAHFYDHFTFYGVDPFTLALPVTVLDNPTSIFTPVLSADNFSGEFDALEAFNGKNLDILRRPTYAEIKDYNVKLAKFLAVAKQQGYSYDELMRGWGKISAEAQREFLRRTEEEQQVAISYSNDNFACRCTADAECGAGFLCDPDTGSCAPSCASDAACAAGPVAAKREACQAKGDSGAKACVRLSVSCQKDADCTYAWPKDASGSSTVAEKCVDGTCQIPCTAAFDCKVDKLRPVCDSAKSICIARTAAKSGDPCRSLRGTIDDWFQMLNRGIYRPILGNSDTHGTYGVESGIPRNYVKSSSDLPPAIDPAEVAASVKAYRTFATYGPFLQFSVEGKVSGETLTAQKDQTVKLQLRVQSPLWYDVDRIEIYKNGALLKVISGSDQCPAQSTACIRSPNDQVVNFEGVIPDKVTGDAWYVVAVMGLDGKTLAPVYSSTPVARLGMFELIQRLTPLLPPLKAFRIPLSPSMTTVRPYAITNPVFVDMGGDGIKPKASLPDWATKKDLAAAGIELSESAPTATSQSALQSAGPHPPAHNHAYGLGKMANDAAWFDQASKNGQITPELLQKVMESLRYLGN